MYYGVYNKNIVTYTMTKLNTLLRLALKPKRYNTQQNAWKNIHSLTVVVIYERLSASECFYLSKSRNYIRHVHPRK